ncbi:MAG: hypothetical protein U0X92_06250 [Anaerolineales bacterium]
MTDIILASNSPRRRELLALLQMDFTVSVAALTKACARTIARRLRLTACGNQSPRHRKQDERRSNRPCG